MSGGQQQRVALARALVASPTALLFDEPLSNVDAQVRKRLREEIRQMKIERGFAGVYVTHDQEEAMALADVLAVMQDGEIRQTRHALGDLSPAKEPLRRALRRGGQYTAGRVTSVNGRSLVADTAIGPVQADELDVRAATGRKRPGRLAPGGHSRS